MLGPFFVLEKKYTAPPRLLLITTSYCSSKKSSTVYLLCQFVSVRMGFPSKEGSRREERGVSTSDIMSMIPCDIFARRIVMPYLSMVDCANLDISMTCHANRPWYLNAVKKVSYNRVKTVQNDDHIQWMLSRGVSCTKIMFGGRVTEASVRGTLKWNSGLVEVDFLGPRTSSLSDEVLLESPRTLLRVNLWNCMEITSTGIRNLAARCPELISIKPPQTVNDDMLITIGQSFAKITEINLCGCVDVTDEGVEIFARNCPFLRYINVSGEKGTITDVSLRAIASFCRSLEVVVLGFCAAITDDGLNSLASSCPDIRDLSLRCCWRITNASIQNVALKCRQLKRLSVVDSPCVTITKDVLRALVPDKCDILIRD